MSVEFTYHNRLKLDIHLDWNSNIFSEPVAMKHTAGGYGEWGTMVNGQQGSIGDQ